jgi:hypothetical protein
MDGKANPPSTIFAAVTAPASYVKVPLRLALVVAPYELDLNSTDLNEPVTSKMVAASAEDAVAMTNAAAPTIAPSFKLGELTKEKSIV